ncbi:hypothetical protein QYF61_017995 [Mycteria americana]|uniref:Uncharacterized protein n=1 Tax=Mycteria americana TaxID=33587 RepID=A0AAN7PKE7_MYCAM|nr:hypothetical protein QYF61_017995 [Mycteria americana]
MSKTTKKGFYKYLGDKRKARENVGPLLNETGHLVTQGMEKAEVLNVFFIPVFSSKTGLQESQASETRGKGWSKEDVLLVEKVQFRKYVSKLDIHKSMDPDGMHPEVLRELTDVIARPLLIIFVRKAKVHVELNLVMDVKGNTKSFYRYISCKRKTREDE